MSKEDRIVVVGLGETLFDCFPDRNVLGGAPLNFAVHADRLLRQVGGEAVPLTRVGTDQLGREAISSIAERGISTDFVQRDPNQPTGRVRVTLDQDGVAEYAFDPESAWDHIELDSKGVALAESCDAVCFGTLAQRNATSRASITAFLASAKNALRVFDVNLREDYFSEELVQESLTQATAAKANEEEIDVLAGWFLSAAQRSGDQATNAERLRERFDLEWLAVTRGPRGVAVASRDGWVAPTSSSPEFEPAPDADTVGAGDACCAALVVGHLLGWPHEKTVSLANRVGAFVATQPGATPPLPEALVVSVTA